MNYITSTDRYGGIDVAFSEEDAKALVRMIEGAQLPERRIFYKLKESIKKEFKI